MKFIKLGFLRDDGAIVPGFINVARIISIYKEEEGGTYISLIDYDSPVITKETIVEVMKKIQED